MTSNSETKERQFRPRFPPALLTREDIDAIRHAMKIHGGIKKCTEHYKIGSQRVKNIWKAESPYDHANSNGPPNLPPWFVPKDIEKNEANVKDTDVKSIENSNPDADEKRKKKEDDIRRAVKALKKLVNSEY